MTDQPGRVTPGEIIRPARRRPPARPRRAAGRPARLPRAEGVPAVPDRRRPGTAEAHQVAADAWHYVSALAARRDAPAEVAR